MPRDGDTPLARVALALVRGHGMALGTPRQSDDGSFAIVPIRRTARRHRTCVPAAEASDLISASDPGRLDRLSVRNAASFAVFLPPGSLFRASDTASRATTVGCALPPRSESSVEVKCVQSFRPLAAGAPLLLDPRLAPGPICEALASRDQARVWAAVSHFGRSVRPDVPSSADDLFAALDDARPVTPPDDEESQPHAPPDECGVAVLDARGVSAVEWVDSPETWRLLRTEVIRRHTQGIRPPHDSPWSTSLDPDGAIRVTQEFLTRLAETPALSAGGSPWFSEDTVAQVSLAEDEPIHLLVLRRHDETSHASTGAEPVAAPLGDHSEARPELGSLGAPPSSDGEVASAGMPSEALVDEALAPPPVGRPRRRKILTSGWDDVAFGALERYAYKEFEGDRSAAMRFLVRQGLRGRGYLGLLPLPEPAPLQESPARADASSPSAERSRAILEARIADLGRIAEAPQYAAWLRKRARLELDHLATSVEDESLRSSARAALHLLSPAEPEPLEELPPTVEEPRPEPAPVPEPPEPEATRRRPVTPPPPPPDMRPLLREAFGLSAGGDYRQAVELFDRILAGDAANRTARLGRAVALRRAGKPQEALADLDAVLRLEPSNAAALLARGQILQARGDLEGALAAFDALVEIAATDWDVWMARGDVLAKMGRNPDALASYAEALRRNPDDQGLQARIHALEIAAEPAPPTTLPRPTRPPGIEDGQSYLLWEDHHERSLSLFRALAALKMPSLILTGRLRDQVRKEAGVGSARIVGLSYVPGEDVHSPTALASLARTVERFIEDNQGQGVILLDGLDDLVSGNGFRDTLLFIEHLNEAVAQSQAILLVSVATDAFEEREGALLERSLHVLPADGSLS